MASKKRTASWELNSKLAAPTEVGYVVYRDAWGRFCKAK
jgi:hypothetical protein